MRCNKNITLKLENISSYFTGKRKIITLSLIILMLSFINITLGSSNNSNSVLSLFGLSSTSVSALSYESNVGIGFSFNPTLSISFSSSDLVISNLTPGTTSDSNNIVVSVSTNAAYGYTLSTNVGSNDITSPYYGSSDLIHSNNSNNGSNSSNSSNHVFSSIATDANLSSLNDSTDNNIWGYSYKLSSTDTWSNYNGLPLYTSTPTTLVNADDQSSKPIDFKIGAKASTAQASGSYTNTINFIAVSKPIPMSLAEAYASEGKTMFNGYYTMQDMTSAICEKTEAIDSQLQVMDVRDRKIYWIAKLKDDHCWMTQNLDLDLSHDIPLTSSDTDLTDHSLSGVYADGYSYDAEAGVTTWVPSTYAETVNFEGTSVRGWHSSMTEPSSASKMDDISTGHLSSGNWYNYTAAIASNNSSGFNSGNATNSICPSNWRLPNASNNEFTILNNLYNNGSTSSDANLIIAPLWLTKSGTADNNSLVYFSTKGYYWSATAFVSTIAKNLRFASSSVQPNYIGSDYGRDSGFSVRCLAR